MTKDYTVQVEKSIYESTKYLNISRFVSYLEQLKRVIGFGKDLKIAEIGKGNGLLASMLKSFGYDVTTFDFDSALEPDIVCSVLELKDKISEKYDVVTCFEVLEHLAFDDFENALDNLKSISKDKILISLPYAGYSVRLQLYLSKYGERDFTFLIRIPMFWSNHKFNGQHYWEPGKKHFSQKKITSILKEQFPKVLSWKQPYNKSQLFFECSVK